ncbi:MAG: VUT family protein [Sphaerochaetaceae bacterium]|nr:VUT family protein [Sphaerochaetaceae bacterium]
MLKWIWAISYILSIIIANILVDYFGIVNFLGLTFPAGVVLVGLTFSFRDFVQKYWGTWKIWFFIIIAAFITLFMNWQLALASVSAFIVAETIDWLIFTITKKDFVQRILLSNTLSTPLDSILFVFLAFGWNWDAIWGQAIIKYLSSLIVIPIIIYCKRIKKCY